MQPSEILEFYLDLTEGFSFDLETAGIVKGWQEGLNAGTDGAVAHTQG